MLFSSAIFLFVFLPVVFLLSRLLSGIRAKNLLLTVASLIFYAFGQLYYLPLFLLSVAINYLSGVLLMRREGNRRAVLSVSVVLNLGILCLFKYTDFLLANVNALTGAAIPATGIVLPIGISFFTFQGLSYVIDVYRDPDAGTRDFLRLLLYISFFPQLIAGPIVKYHDISAQIDQREASAEDAASGVMRFCLGLSKKILISNAVGKVADIVFDTYLPVFGSGLDFRLALLGAVCYSLQIYFDFSGYSDMAVGMGRMFGFRIPENFRLPYAADSIQDFWRRWHISLSSWFREYLYIPLGGNRKGRLRTAFNRLFVFLCTGFWHGANWTFLVWGLGHGLLSSLEGAGLIPAKRLSRSRGGRLLCRVYTLAAVVLLFVIFRADNLSAAFALIAAIFSGHVAADGGFLLRELLPPATVFVLLVALLSSGRLADRAKAALSGGGQRPVVRAASFLLCLALYLLSVMSLSRGGFNPFIYFQF